MNRRSQTGQALVLAAVGLTVLMLASGLAIDMGYLRYQKRRMQTAADSAALAAAAELGYDTVCSANVDSSLNGFTDPAGISGCPGASTVTGTSTVTVKCATGLLATFSPAPCTLATPYVEVTVSQNQPTFFMRIGGYNNVSMSVDATGFSSTGCIYALSSGPDAIQMAYGGSTSPVTAPPGNPGFVIYPPNSTPETIVVAPGCSLISDGTLNLPNNGGGGKSHYLYTASAGGTTVNDAGNTNENPPVSRLVAASDPLAYIFSSGGVSLTSVSACTGTPTQVTTGVFTPSGGCGVTVTGSGTVTLQPGNYPGGIQITGSVIVTFNPGLYVVSGNGLPCPTASSVPVSNYGQSATFGTSCSLSIDSTGNVSGSDVTFYNSGGSGAGSISINYGASLSPSVSAYPGATVQLSASTDGANGGVPGILIYQDPSNNQPASITLAGYDSATPLSSYLWGALYLPDAQLSLYGIGYGMGGTNLDSCSIVPRLTSVVAYKLVLDGNLNLNSDDCDWTWPDPPAPYTFSPAVPELIKASAVLVR